jgi:hypothetical protein
MLGSRLRATVAVLAAATASLALAGTAGASSGGVVIDAQDICDPASFITDGIPTDGTTVRIPAAKLARGTNLFECMIHPWMHAKVTVE